MSAFDPKRTSGPSQIRPVPDCINTRSGRTERLRVRAFEHRVRYRSGSAGTHTVAYDLGGVETFLRQVARGTPKWRLNAPLNSLYAKVIDAVASRPCD